MGERDEATRERMERLERTVEELRRRLEGLEQTVSSLEGEIRLLNEVEDIGPAP